MKTRLVVPATGKFALKALFTVGTPGKMVTQAPVIEVPEVAELVTAAVMLVTPLKLPFPLVLAA